MDIVSNNQDPIHFTFYFLERDTFSLYRTQIRVPRENRFIATYEPKLQALCSILHLRNMPFNTLGGLMMHLYQVFISSLILTPIVTILILENL